MQKIRSARLWQKPGICMAILSGIPSLDPLPLLLNPKVYYIERKGKPVSFAVVNGKELCNVYTREDMRGKGFSKALISHIIKMHRPIYLITKERYRFFYKKLGFRPTNAPFPISAEVFVWNSLIRFIFFQQKVFCMKSSS